MEAILLPDDLSSIRRHLREALDHTTVARSELRRLNRVDATMPLDQVDELLRITLSNVGPDDLYRHAMLCMATADLRDQTAIFKKVSERLKHLDGALDDDGDVETG